MKFFEYKVILEKLHEGGGRKREAKKEETLREIKRPKKRKYVRKI